MGCDENCCCCCCCYYKSRAKDGVDAVGGGDRTDDDDDDDDEGKTKKKIVVVVVGGLLLKKKNCWSCFVLFPSWIVAAAAGAVASGAFLVSPWRSDLLTYVCFCERILSFGEVKK